MAENDSPSGIRQRRPTADGGNMLDRTFSQRRSTLTPDLVERSITLTEEIEADMKRLARVEKRRYAIGGDATSTAVASAAGSTYRRAQLRATVSPMFDEFMWVMLMEFAWDPWMAAAANVMEAWGGPAHRAAQFVDWLMCILWTVMEFGGCGNYASFALAAGLGSCRPLTVVPLALSGVAAVFVARSLLALVGIMPVPMPRDEWRILSSPPLWTPHDDFDGIILEEFIRILWAIGIYSIVLWLKGNVSANVRRVAVPTVVVAGIYQGGFRNPTQVGADALFRRDIPLRAIRMATMSAGAFIAGRLFRTQPEDSADSD